MSLKQIIFNAFAKNAGKNLDKSMDRTLKQAKNDGFQVTFYGVYKQTTAVEGSLEMPVAFAIAQTPEQITQLNNGILEGKVYDMGRFASIEGTIDSKAVEFNKRYETSSVPKETKKAILGLRNILEPTHKGKPLLNPSTIRYQAQSENEGDTYEGTWNFNYKPADMATEGTFKMLRSK